MSWRSELEDNQTIVCQNCKAEFLSVATNCPQCGSEVECGEYLYSSEEECIASGDHLSNCDVDGYCNLCGSQ